MTDSAPLPREPATRGKPWIRVLVFAVPLLVYLAGLRYAGSGDTQPAELLPISILQSGNLDFNEFVAPGTPLPYWFHRVGSRVVSTYPILPGILNLPTYAVARQLGVPLLARREILSLVTASIIAALSALFLFQTLLELGLTQPTALLFSFVYAFGTCMWSVASRGLWQHGPSVLFLTMALWLTCRRRERKEKDAAWIGGFLALAVLSRPSTLLLAIPLAAVACRRRPERLAALLLGAAVPGALHVWYCAAYLGTPLSSGFWNPFPETANFSGNPLVGLAGILLSPSRGLLVFSPFFLFSVPGILRGIPRADRRALTLAMTAGIVATLALYSFWSIWWGGHSFGYRLLIELAPFLTVLAAFWWETQTFPPARACFLLMLAWSLYAQLLGATVQPSGFNEILDREPRVLWSIRNSEIAISTERLIERLR